MQPANWPYPESSFGKEYANTKSYIKEALEPIYSGSKEYSHTDIFRIIRVITQHISQTAIKLIQEANGIKNMRAVKEYMMDVGATLCQYDRINPHNPKFFNIILPELRKVRISMK